MQTKLTPDQRAFDIVYHYYKKLHRTPDGHTLMAYVSSDPVMQAKYRGAGHTYQALSGKKINQILKELHTKLEGELNA